MPLETVDLDKHCTEVLTRMARGSVVPFLGAGVNRCGRPQGEPWGRDTYLPDGGELSRHLADTYGYPEPDNWNLGRVSQFVELELREMALYTDLREIFTGAYGPTEVHKLLAELPARDARTRTAAAVPADRDDELRRCARAGLRTRPGSVRSRLLLRRTEQKPGEFVHVVKDKPVRVTQQYRKLMLDDQPTVLKIHGAVDREDETRDSYVVTEDHYIDYLARTNLDKLIPASLMREMKTSHFLFLGYGMRDWNLRVILKHVWAEQRRRGVSWAVQHDADEIDRKFWSREGVNVVITELHDWVDAMRRNLP